MNNKRKMKIRLSLLLVFLSALSLVARAEEAGSNSTIPSSEHNLLLDATLSGNLPSFNKGNRGAPDHVIYDLNHQRFLKPTEWHEYGVGYKSNLGVVPEAKAAHWMAEWKTPVAANCIVLTGAYSNQPQPDTAWKVELRRDGQWHVHARGVGGWYNHGRYVWDFGDGSAATGKQVTKSFGTAGIYRVTLRGADSGGNDSCSTLVRVHTPETVNLPQVILDTDAKNEVDDQHYISYALFSGLDVLGINSIHHGGGQEPVNYGEIQHILELAKRTGLPDARLPNE